MANIYGCKSSGLGLESRVGPSLVFFCQKILSNSPGCGLGSCWRYFTPVPRRTRVASYLRLISHQSVRIVVPLEHESDRNRVHSCLYAYILCIIILPPYMACRAEFGKDIIIISISNFLHRKTRPACARAAGSSTCGGARPLPQTPTARRRPRRRPPRRTPSSGARPIPLPPWWI